MSRRWWVAIATIGASLVPAPSMAQSAEDPPERIDILIPQEDYEEPLEDCSAEQEAASISGEIIVCRRRRDGSEFGYDAERAQQRYAEQTMNRGDPRAPDLAPNYPGVVVARGCFIPPCPPPAAIMIDIEALPEAPPGSDADRAARGLAPSGGPPPSGTASRQEELGLPPPPESEGDASVSPSGSASPAETPSG